MARVLPTEVETAGVATEPVTLRLPLRLSSFEHCTPAKPPTFTVLHKFGIGGIAPPQLTKPNYKVA
jgi:hypothetical protein